MNIWDIADYDGEFKPRHTGRKINKNKFCKKNKHGGGKYGPHIYDGKFCKFCGKINPATKNRPNIFKEIDKEE